MLKIYGSDLSGPANKVRFTANALGLNYEYIRVNLREGEQRKPEFVKLNPVAKIPVLDDDGFVLFESGAIIKYLTQKQKSELYPGDIKKRAIVDQWIDFAVIHVGQALSRLLYNRVFAPMRKEEVDERSIKDGINFLSKFLPIVDERLGKSKYLASDQLTLADITLLSVLDPAEISGVNLLPYKNIVAWREAMKQKDFYTKCHKEYGEALRKPAAK